jgi:microcompartment protein CcmK/EutM
LRPPAPGVPSPTAAHKQFHTSRKNKGDAVILGRVLGTVVSTVQHPFYAGRKQLLVGAVLPDGALDGTRYILALDMVGAGVGQTVLVEDEGNSARQILEDPKAPVRSLIVAIVDQVDAPAPGGV